jgi:hypothetical protein
MDAGGAALEVTFRSDRGEEALEAARALATERETTRPFCSGSSTWSTGRRTERFLSMRLVVSRDQVALFDRVHVSTGAAGNSTRKVEPLPTSLSTVSVPPLDVTMTLQIERPSPIP